MEKKLKILLLCGGAFAFKTIQLLENEKYLFAIGIGGAAPSVSHPLEDACENNDIHFKSFATKKDVKNLAKWINDIKPDFVFSVSFPFLIPENALSLAEEKFINFHPGPLPEYRGVMPVFEVLKNEEKETAISVHFMNSKFDEGDVIFIETVSINPDDTYGNLSTRLSVRMAQVVLNTAEMLQFVNKIPRRKQDTSKANYYGKPEIYDTKIDWITMEASEIVALIKACNPWNEGADTMFDGKPIKIIEAIVCENQHEGIAAGTITSVRNNSVFEVACINKQQISVSIIKNENGYQSVQALKNTANYLHKILI
ncbi:MAG: methionyl-tRNA formyltransferase [Flavobacterium sp.]